MSHVHEWRINPSASRYAINRYNCDCGRWAYRSYTWARNGTTTLGPLKIYKQGYKPEAEPTVISRNDPEMYQLDPNRQTTRKRDWPW